MFETVHLRARRSPPRASMRSRDVGNLIALFGAGCGRGGRAILLLEDQPIRIGNHIL